MGEDEPEPHCRGRREVDQFQLLHADLGGSRTSTLLIYPLLRP